MFTCPIPDSDNTDIYLPTHTLAWNTLSRALNTSWARINQILYLPLLLFIE